ncbi:lipoprotein LpqH [Mycolicibacterium grossiae]|uniref:Lipoprotein n=1 Tax=Mycolicibacterium grossiae TaxID=1552759 RepID=A0A1E8Q0M8_9MYCO|nr:lipoprotein LpqH [Mycolicibacterium grossiae]OFJ51987.1 hypothetical protein BEL07_20085 [Mycolicibacterium grossiae]QEM47811.1 hypothetical protein FZ046_26350 [Mycolicibacterium grossiae]
MRVTAAASTTLGCAVLILAGCANDAPTVETTLVFDGDRHTITTTDVTCSRDGDVLIIFVDGPGKQMVRAVVLDRGRLRADRVAVRYDELAGFTSDRADVDVTRSDDTYQLRGRMPPNAGETAAHSFEIVTTCPEYRPYVPPPGSPPRVPIE